MTWDDGYVVEVADGLLFSLGAAWQRLTAYDRDVDRGRVNAAVSALAALGVERSFGAGPVPAVPSAGAIHVAVLREHLRRIGEIAPHVLAAPADAFARLLCTDPWPRIYTTAVLDAPPVTPVHVVQATDLAQSRTEWLRSSELERFTAVRALVMFGLPSGGAFPFDLGRFPELRQLDLSDSHLHLLPLALASATGLEALWLARNPIDVAALAPLAQLPRLRYIDLRGTRVHDPAAVRAHVPAACVVDV